jgi:hypothetical protein
LADGGVALEITDMDHAENGTRSTPAESPPALQQSKPMPAVSIRHPERPMKVNENGASYLRHNRTHCSGRIRMARGHDGERSGRPTPQSRTY